MILWRISPFADLSGVGGLTYSGRWHNAGRPVVYLAESPAGALLEICAHTSEESVPRTFSLLKISGPEIALDEVAFGDLPAGWADQVAETQRLGSEWLDGGWGVLLRVPSVLVPETWNLLLNPLHPGAADFVIAGRYEYPFDLRLKR